MIAYQTDADGVFVGVVACDESPLESGVFLVPRGAVEVEPPTFGDGQAAVWNGSEWSVVDLPAVGPEPEPEIELTWDIIRADRNRLLTACDWTQVADAPLTAAQKQAWAAYRQTLRDIPQDYDHPDDVVWPEAP